MAQGLGGMARQVSRARGSLAATLVLSFLSWACSESVAPTSLRQASARASASAAPQSEVIPGQYIVTFKDDVTDPPGLAKQLVTQHGGQLGFTYTQCDPRVFRTDVGSSRSSAAAQS